MAAQSLTQIAPQTIAISKATAAAQDLFAVIDRKSAMDLFYQEGTKIDGFKGEVKLRGRRFEYPSRPDVPVLHGLDLDIPADKTTALVGASGSGNQLGADDAGQGLEYVAAPLRAAAALVRQDLEAG